MDQVIAYTYILQKPVMFYQTMDGDMTINIGDISFMRLQNMMKHPKITDDSRTALNKNSFKYAYEPIVTLTYNTNEKTTIKSGLSATLSYDITDLPDGVTKESEDDNYKYTYVPIVTLTYNTNEKATIKSGLSATLSYDITDLPDGVTKEPAGDNYKYTYEPIVTLTNIIGETITIKSGCQTQYINYITDLPDGVELRGAKYFYYKSPNYLTENEDDWIFDLEKVHFEIYMKGNHNGIKVSYRDGLQIQNIMQSEGYGLYKDNYAYLTSDQTNFSIPNILAGKYTTLSQLDYRHIKEPKGSWTKFDTNNDLSLNDDKNTYNLETYLPKYGHI